MYSCDSSLTWVCDILCIRVGLMLWYVKNTWILNSTDRFTAWISGIVASAHPTYSFRWIYQNCMEICFDLKKRSVKGQWHRLCSGNSFKLAFLTHNFTVKYFAYAQSVFRWKGPRLMNVPLLKEGEFCLALATSTKRQTTHFRIQTHKYLQVHVCVRKRKTSNRNWRAYTLCAYQFYFFLYAIIVLLFAFGHIAFHRQMHFLVRHAWRFSWAKRIFQLVWLRPVHLL